MNVSRFVASICFLVAVAAVAGLCLPAHSQYGTPTVTGPQYGAGLGQAQPQGEPPWVKRLEDQLKSVKDDVAYIRKELDDTAEAKAGAPPANGGNPDLQRAVDTCAQCHMPDVAVEKGGGFKLFTEQGQFREFSERDIRKIVTELEGRTMPPPKSKITMRSTEYAAMIEAFKPSKPKESRP